MVSVPWPHRMARDGFVLLAILWVIVGLTVLAALAGHAARDGLVTVRRRAELERSLWRAEDCMSRVRFVVDQALASERDVRPTSASWRRLDSVVTASAIVDDCPGQVSLTAGGSMVDVNVASSAQLRRAFRQLASNGALADSLTDSVLDWRDADHVAHPLGAESEWYGRQKLHPPRNGALADVRELARVRGADRIPGLDQMFGVETGPVSLAVAPLRVLRTLPGFTDEVIVAMAEARERGEVVHDVLQLHGRVSASVRDSLLAHHTEIVLLSSAEPETWTIRALGHEVEGAARTMVEVRLARAGTRAAVVRRRVLP